VTLSALELTLVLLATSVLGVVAFRLFDMPATLGYLAVGVLVGPHALRLVPDDDATRYLAEFGVVFLMFSIGLEFSLPKLRGMRSLVVRLGLPQVVFTIALVTIAAVVVGPRFGVGAIAGVSLGGALAMSSTAIVMKLLAERMELETEHGRRIVGVLLFQDLAVVPLLVIVPALATTAEQLAGALAVAAIKAVAVLVLLLVGGQWLIGRVLDQVARRRTHELFTLTLLLITLGLAWLTERAGLSLALGAFVAGMLISETHYRHQVEEDIKPFRDVLLGLFFITLGMRLDLRLVVAHWPWIAAALLLPTAFKFGLVVALVRATGGSGGTAIRTALPLATAGEFGFVLVTQATNLELFPPELAQVALAAMVMSMIATPFLVRYSDRIALRLAGSEWMMRALDLHRIATRAMATEGHVVICGFGRAGQHRAKMVEQENIAYVALDLDPDRVREATAAGDSVVYGDAARRETLIAAGVGRAAALVISYNDAASALKVVHFAHQISPRLPIIVRTEDDADLDRLLAAGVTEVVPEVFEGSLMLGSHALVLLGVPVARVVRRVRAARDSRYRLLRGYFHGADDSDDGLDEVDHERLHSVPLESGSPAIGQRLGELGLAALGVDVTAVRRRGIRGPDPSGDLVLQTGDVVVLRGVSAAIELAEERLIQA
jgi:CPA2 family monovalent cation:H+ antiporter-2